MSMTQILRMNKGVRGSAFRLYSDYIVKMKVKPLVLCGPSGVGKSTLLKKLMEEYGSYFGFSVSHTTRQPRPGEEKGVHYHYVSREEMKSSIDCGEFIEHAEFSGNIYGTSKKAVNDVLDKGLICILDIDTQGVKQVKETDLDPICVFIKPPSIQDLEQRLRGRGTETDDSLNRRLSVARGEMDYGEEPGNFDKVVINDNVEKAYGELKEFIIPVIERLQKKDD